MDSGEFLLDVEAVGRKVAAYVEELTGADVSDAEDDAEGNDAGDGYCEDAGNPTGFEAAYGWREKKRQGEGEGERNKEFAGEVEDQNGDGEHEKRANPGQLGASSMRHYDPRGAWIGLFGQEYINDMDASVLRRRRDRATTLRNFTGRTAGDGVG